MIAKVANTVAEGLRTQPLALALVMINILFLFGGGWLLRDIAMNVRANTDRHSALVEKLVSECVLKKEGQ